uniref:Reverse transcriptase domain-containing protein n=1 Tax=Amphimedon queenslandica TaxID=400682 RepID=A0A1X7T194_AMPQE
MYGIVPSEWKVHKITPVFKAGDTQYVENYRPISLLCILSKVLESIIYAKIIPFLSDLLCRHQFGFLKGRSAVSQLLITYNNIMRNCESGQSTDQVYFDFSKAFDSVPHSLLLYKLWMLGITGPLWCWFKDYLNQRMHFVEIEGCSSQMLPVRSGVPQGSILGPLLFLVFVNDIPDVIDSSHLFLFADDSKLQN